MRLSRHSFLLVAVLTLFLSPILTQHPTAAAYQDYAELVPIYNADGESIGQIYLVSPYNPFEVVEPGNELQPGTHYILLEIGFINTGSEPLPYDPDAMLLVDSNGFVYKRVIINNLTAESTNYFTGTGTVPPSEDFYGDNAYLVPDGTVVDRIVYSSGINHISVYDGRTATTPSGNPVPFNDQTGQPTGQAGVLNVTDPFDAYDPATAPEAGTRFVAVEVMLANQGQQPVSLALTDIRAIDELGRLIQPATVTLSDPAMTLLADGDVAPGGQTQGLLILQIPEGGSLSQITWADGGARDQVLADFEVQASTTDSTGGCAGFVEWAVDTLGAAGTVQTFGMNLMGANPETLDAGMLSIYYQQAESALQDQLQITPPPAVEPVHTYVIDNFLTPMVDALERLMNGVASGDYASAQTALDDITATMGNFNPGSEGAEVMQSVQTTCPDEWDELMSMGG